jgi:opacity protein-like surface antigen|tara:strand:- start:504 stop:1031 length:528 start_codon:yes stop_codon:yes gene_type:complete
MRVKIICLILGLIVAVPSNAGTENLYIGASYLNSNTEFSGYSDDVDGYELDLGYSFSKHFAAEVSYFDLGNLQLPSIPDAGGNIDSDGVSLQIVAKLPINKFTLYGKFGNLWWDQDVLLNTIAGPIRQDTNGNDLIYGIGFGYAVTPHLTVGLEFKATDFGDNSTFSSLGMSYHF